MRAVMIMTMAMLLLLPGVACNKSQAGDTFEQRNASAEQRLSATTRLMSDLGITGDVMVSTGPSYWGLFEGLLLDPGVRINAYMHCDPGKASMLAVGLKAMDQGKSYDEALAAAKAAAPAKADEKSATTKEVIVPSAAADGG